MPVLRSASRFASRAIAVTMFARATKRFPIIGIILFAWRLLRRHSQRVERTSVRMHAGETITLQEKRG